MSEVRIKKAYPRVTDGEWIQPVRKGYRMMCCDCGLVHTIDFRLVKDSIGRATIQYRPYRHERATAAARAARRKKGKKQ